MNFKLCLVGHSNYINDLETVIYNNFFNIEVYKVIFNTDVDIKSAILEIEKNIKHCDAILYTGIEPFLLISQKINNSITSSYVSIKKQDLVHCLLKSTYNFDFNIYDISIDSMDYNSIVETYNSLSLDIKKLKVNIVEIKTKEYNFVSKAEQEHTKNYKNKLSSICITSITAIYNNLKKSNIPCVLLTPSMENYISEVKTLILRDKIKKTENNEISILTIKISQNSDFYVLNNNDLQEILEINVASQYIAVFCQKLEGALYTINNNNYVIICNSKRLELLTNDFNNIELLTQIPRDTQFSINIGVGYGESLSVAKKHSLIACNRSTLYGNDTAFIMYEPKNVVGPIKNDKIKPIDEKMYNERLIEVSSNSKLSINTVYKINCIIKQLNKSEFTAQELALELGVTVRTASRIILKLEDANYIKEVGRHIIESKGRPSRIVKILI